MLARLEELRGLVGQDEDTGFREEAIGKELEQLRGAYLEKARELSLRRSEAAGRLSGEVESNLANLDMPHAILAIKRNAFFRLKIRITDDGSRRIC